MSIIIIIYLFICILYGLGNALTPLMPGGRLEKISIRIALGASSISILAIAMNTCKIPLDWRIFLILALIVPVHMFKKYLINLFLHDTKSTPFIKKRGRPSKGSILALGIFFVSLIIYTHGAFSYPWLENDDSWTHAASSKYIAVEKNLNMPEGIFQYLNPYPPGYNLLFALLNQMHPSMHVVLKSFNAFIAAFSLLLFYFFSLAFTRDKRKSILAMFFLACVPCYLSHFIWAHSLAIMLLFPGLYFVLKSFDHRRYLFPGSILWSGIFLTQPTQSLKFCVLAGILILAYKMAAKKSLRNPCLIILIGGILSLAWWGPKIHSYFNGSMTLTLRNGGDVPGENVPTDKTFKNKLFSPSGGTATRAYTLIDYFYLPSSNLINNPIGVGTLLMFLALMGLFLILHRLIENKYEGEPVNKSYALTLLGWLLFTFLGMNSQTFHLPIGLFAFRFWMLFAIPIALLAAETLTSILPKNRYPTTLQTFALIISLGGVILTSGAAKLRINTGLWPWGIYWNSPHEIKGYLWLRKHLPPDTKVFTFQHNLFVIGMDMRADYWRETYTQATKNAMALPMASLHKQLTHLNYKYIIISEREIRHYGIEVIREKLTALQQDTRFQLVHLIPNRVWIFKIN